MSAGTRNSSHTLVGRGRGVTAIQLLPRGPPFSDFRWYQRLIGRPVPWAIPGAWRRHRHSTMLDSTESRPSMWCHNPRSRVRSPRGARGDGDVAHESGRHHPSHLRLGWFRVADDPCADCPLDLDLGWTGPRWISRTIPASCHAGLAHLRALVVDSRRTGFGPALPSGSNSVGRVSASQAKRDQES